MLSIMKGKIPLENLINFLCGLWKPSSRKNKAFLNTGFIVTHVGDDSDEWEKYEFPVLPSFIAQDCSL